MDQFLEPVGPVAFSGVDVSEFQGDIDFSRVLASGREGVYIRSGVGADYTDARLKANYASARAAGMKTGFYHYVTARNTAEAEAEARYFAENLRGKVQDLRPAMDFEYLSGLTGEQANAIALRFLETLAALTGKTPAIYTGASNARGLWAASIAVSYPLWVAEWDADAPEYNDKWPGWSAWQHADDGRVSGIPERVDLDYFTDHILCEDPSPNSGDAPARPGRESKLICVPVEPGDTLWGMARRYGTTVRELVRLNDVSNPDLIYPGQRLYVRVSASFDAPCCDSYVVRKGDTLWGIARRFSTTVARLAGINKIRVPGLIYPDETLTLGLCPDSSGER